MSTDTALIRHVLPLTPAQQIRRALGALLERFISSQSLGAEHMMRRLELESYQASAIAAGRARCAEFSAQDAAWFRRPATR